MQATKIFRLTLLAVIANTLTALLFSGSAFALGGEETFNLHGQATVIPQYHGVFTSPYEGNNSLNADQETKTSFTSTLFFGYRPWAHGELYFNPEFTGGTGLSATHGVADFLNGEIYRVDTAAPTFNLSRLFIRQVYGFVSEESAGDSDFVDSDKNQLATYMKHDRLVLTLGKLSLNDIFDANTYSHDPRTQFLNWGFMDNGAWDYAADTRGYTWGVFLDFTTKKWSLRLGTAQEPQTANAMELDENLAQAHADTVELESRFFIAGYAGVARLLGFINHAYMGTYNQALAASAGTGAAPSLATTRAYTTKTGIGLNLQQALSDNIGVFSRVGYNDGKTETWAFTEVDSTASLGLSLKGALWRRDEDVLGLAAVVSGLSPDHRNYLAAGGQGFILGDGALTYAPEEVAEIYYLYSLGGYSVSPDVQYVVNPGYNHDRGPLPVFAVRFHGEF